MMKLLTRMEQALEKWKPMPNGIPDGNSVCHLIESIETDEDTGPSHVKTEGGNDGTSGKRT